MITLEQLNLSPPEDFVARLAGIFEHSPWVAERVTAARPFRSRLQLLDAMRAAVSRATPEEQMSLILAHPKLGARGRAQAALTASSQQEQKRAGLDACNDEEFARLQTLNEAYGKKFGFPFILAVRGHVPASILAEIGARLGSDPQRERQTALREIGIIAGFRLADLVESPVVDEILAMRERLSGSATVDGRAALLREWLRAAGFEIETGAGGSLRGRLAGGVADSTMGREAGDAIATAPTHLGHGETPVYLTGIAVVQSLRHSGIRPSGDVLIVVASPDLEARAAVDASGAASVPATLEREVRRIREFLLQETPASGSNTKVIQHG